MKNIILADNQPMFRAGVAKTLVLQEDTRIVAQCANAERLLNAVRSFSSTIVIFASSLNPDLPTIVQAAQSAVSKLIVIAENSEPRARFPAHSFDGVLSREVAGEELIKCVNRVASGRIHLRTSIKGESDDVGARVRDRLTPKEIKVVGLIVEGYKNKEIASRLGTTEQVIKNYLRSVFDKTGVSDRLELALFTIHHSTLAEAAALAHGQMQAQLTNSNYKLEV
jgi:DNA-binding NarL/FixJ family response regulator